MMKPYLFTLLLLIFPLNIFAQNDLSPDENRVTFILNISWLLNDNLEVLKGEYIKTESNGKDSIFTCKYLVPGFTTYIKSGGKGAVFDALSGTIPLPIFISLVDKLNSFMYSLAYVKHDSETDPELKAKANNLNVQRIIVFIKQNYEKTEVTSALTLYLISGWNLLCCRFEQCR